MAKRKRQHTPGPWEWEGTFRQGWYATIRPVGTYTRREEMPRAESEANARLISAAPDLLAACREVLARLGLPEVGLGDSRCAATLRAAIARATEPEA